MRHGLEQGGLELVALPRDLRRLCFGREPVLAERLADLVGGRRQEPGVAPPRRTLLFRAGRPDRTERVRSGLDADAIHLEATGATRLGLGRNVDPRPLGRNVPGHPLEHGVEAGVRSRRVPGGVGGRALAGIDAEADPHPIHRGLAGEDPGDDRQHGRRGGTCRQFATHLELGECFALAGQRVLGAGPLACRKLPDDEPDEEEQEQVR